MRGKRYFCSICGRDWPRETERMRDGKTCSKRCASIKGYLSGNHPETSIELSLQASLSELGISYETQRPILGVTVADILVEPNVAIFADGDYWHSSPTAQYKDEKATRKLEKNGYIVLRLRESDIRKNPEETKQKLRQAYERRKISKSL